MGRLLYFPNPVETAYSYPDPQAAVRADPSLSRAARKRTFLVLRPRAQSPLTDDASTSPFDAPWRGTTRSGRPHPPETTS